MRKNIALLTEEELNTIENSKISVETDEVLEESGWWFLIIFAILVIKYLFFS